MSAQKIVWLVFICFLVGVFVFLVSMWRNHKEAREKILRGKSQRQDETFDAELEREKARRIFKGEELQKALEAVAFLEQSKVRLTQAKEQINKGQRSASQLIVFMAIMIVLGILYGLLRFTNAP